MTDIARRRLAGQRLLGDPFNSPEEAVGGLGAVQAQEYAGAKWALGLRTRDVTDADIERSFNSGGILRTHAMRPTWHFVLAEDIRWLLELTASRVKARLAIYDRHLEIDAALLRRSRRVLEAALQGRHLIRSELVQVLERAGIVASGQRLGQLLMHSELDGVVTSGPLRNRQFSYALLEERAPRARRLEREEALAELTGRYFSSHGPAQVQDFAWWSGLKVADVRHGLSLLGTALAQDVIAGRSYWSSPDAVGEAPAGGPYLHLLPNYDEFLVAYRDRSAALARGRFDRAVLGRGSILADIVILDGQVLGAWRRRRQGGQVIVEVSELVIEEAGSRPVREAADRLERFLGVPVTLTGAPFGAFGT
jgi:hypothetical protein